MKTKELDFDVESRIMPNDPVELRGKTRESGEMVVIDRSASSIEHTHFTSICDFFRTGDLLVLNDSYMLSNTLWFESGTQATQMTIHGHEADGSTAVIFQPGSFSPGAGMTLKSRDDERLTCDILKAQGDGLWKVKLEPIDLLMPTLNDHGERFDESVSLDPKAWKTTPQAYRFVYAATPGSLEIPSAGLHFSQELLAQAAAKGVEMAFLTLHVGATEILAVRHISVEEIENHKVRSEYYCVGNKASSQISKARAEGRRVIAVGTTVMRTLETLSVGKEKKEPLEANEGWTDLYIFPGFDFRAVDVLLTNLHRPRSSHIVLTAAFAGKEIVMRSYDEIIERVLAIAPDVAELQRLPTAWKKRSCRHSSREQHESRMQDT